VTGAATVCTQMSTTMQDNLSPPAASPSPNKAQTAAPLAPNGVPQGPPLQQRQLLRAGPRRLSSLLRSSFDARPTDNCTQSNVPRPSLDGQAIQGGDQQQKTFRTPTSDPDEPERCLLNHGWNGWRGKSRKLGTCAPAASVVRKLCGRSKNKPGTEGTCGLRLEWS
jgi:hypothetical protein